MAAATDVAAGWYIISTHNITNTNRVILTVEIGRTSWYNHKWLFWGSDLFLPFWRDFHISGMIKVVIRVGLSRRGCVIIKEKWICFRCL